VGEQSIMLNDELMKRLALTTECIQYRLDMSDITIKLIEIGVGMPECIV
jgi:hypothetical protein